jgi:hypothetical protein
MVVPDVAQFMGNDRAIEPILTAAIIVSAHKPSRVEKNVVRVA